MKKILFAISQLYKGGAETALVNLLNKLDYSKYAVDLLILNQIPVEDAVSLVNRVNEHVKICDAYQKEQKRTFLSKARGEFFYTKEQKSRYYVSALEFVYGKKYDWAFFVGEWCSPEFVAMEVEADYKAAWIHSDISQAAYFNAEEYFDYYDRFNYFIFVSRHSMESSIAKYPFLKSKAVTIYNINDAQYIRERSKESVDDLQREGLPIVLTCANFRPEKNHLRQVEVMNRLKNRGIEFIWVNIGSTANKRLVENVTNLCQKYGLENRFLILGPKENPYKYMRFADAVMVLSDHESWSMVITEAKILGKPVISTKTSGGMEQIEDRKTGLLTDFSVDSIASAIEELLVNKKLYNMISSNISNFDNTEEILDSINKLIEQDDREERDLLYVIDDINYNSGAHSATKLQIQALLKEKRNITIYSSSIPNVKNRKELAGAKFIALRDSSADTLYRRRLLGCLFDKNLTLDKKKYKIKYTIKGYLKKLDYEKEVLNLVSDIFSKYPIVCVMSESSVYRNIVALSKAKKKIQWIHTDYVGWREHSSWTKSITQNDGELYNQYDKIVVLTVEIRDRFIELYPHLSQKVVVNKNLIPISEIQKKARIPQTKNETPINFVTVGRMGSEKEYPRLINILNKLKEEGYQFTWTIIGGGVEFENIKSMVNQFDLADNVKLTGPLENPFPKMKRADVFALLSSYEGLPNTIYEALILGVPVLATNVGGISSQLMDGINGWIVENNSNQIEKKIKHILMNQDEILNMKNNLKSYTYNNQIIIDNAKEILSK